MKTLALTLVLFWVQTPSWAGSCGKTFRDPGHVRGNAEAVAILARINRHLMRPLDSKEKVLAPNETYYPTYGAVHLLFDHLRTSFVGKRRRALGRALLLAENAKEKEWLERMKEIRPEVLNWGQDLIERDHFAYDRMEFTLSRREFEGLLRWQVSPALSPRKPVDSEAPYVRIIINGFVFEKGRGLVHIETLGAQDRQ